MDIYEEYKDSGIDWVGKVPASWKRSRIKFLLSHSSAGVWGEDEKGNKDDIVCFRAADFDYSHGCLKLDNNTVRNIQPKQLEGRVLHKRDLLIEKSGGGDATPVGRIVRFNYDGIATCSNFMHFISVNKNNDDNYLFYYFYAMYANNVNVLYFNQTTGIQNLKVSEYLGQIIFIPSLKEQSSISSYLDKKCSEIDNVISAQQKRIALLQELKQSVITHAVTKGLDPNVEMKDSGVEWIGTVPSHWQLIKIKNLKSKEPNAFVDGPFGSNLKSQHFIDNGDVYVIESGMITTGTFVYRDFKTISKEHFKTIQRSECREGDIIIAKIGMNFGMAGELPKLDKHSVVSGNSLKLTLDRNKMRNLLFVYLLSVAKKNGGYVGLVQETAQPALSLGGLNGFALPVAPMAEQLDIEKYLIKRCTTIDSSISKAQHQVELLQEYKQSLITEVVTGKRKVS